MTDESDLIAAIYDAALDPSRWHEVVKRIVEATKSVSGGLCIQERNATHLSAVHNADPFYEKAFVEFWHKHSPLVAVAATTFPGELRRSTHITQTDSYKASAFCNEFMLPQGWGDMVGIGLLRGPNSFGHLVVHRRRRPLWNERISVGERPVSGRRRLQRVGLADPHS